MKLRGVKTFYLVRFCEYITTASITKATIPIVNSVCELLLLRIVDSEQLREDIELHITYTQAICSVFTQSSSPGDGGNRTFTDWLRTQLMLFLTLHSIIRKISKATDHTPCFVCTFPTYNNCQSH